jgi:polygalacturonase
MRPDRHWLSGFLALAAVLPLACASPSSPSTDDPGGESSLFDSGISPETDTGVPMDAALGDVISERSSSNEPDANSRADAGPADATSPRDAGTPADATSPADSGYRADAGAQMDSSTHVDASTVAPGGQATGDSRNVVQPSLPPVCVTLSAQVTTSQRGSPPSADDTSRIQAALDTCKGTGHGVVLATSGSDNAFFSGTLTVNGEALVVDAGVTLFGNDTYAGELLDVGGVDSAIMGPGTIDGRGDLISGIPRLVQASHVTNFVVYDVTMKNSGKEHLYVEGGNGFTAWNLTIATPADTANTDGIDIDSLTNATVHGCSIEDGDDGIAIKTNSAAASNITVENSTFHGTHGMSIGSQTFDGVVNVLWKGNTVYGSDEWGNVSTDPNGLNIKSDVQCGGTVRQVTYLDTCMTGVKHLLVFNTSYGSCAGTSGTPYFTEILVDGVYAKGSLSGAYSEFHGYSAAAPLGLTLENVHLDVTTQQASEDAHVGIYDSNITPSGTGVTTASVAASGTVPSCSF